MKKQIYKIAVIILILETILQISVPIISRAIVGTSDSRFEYTVNEDGTSITINKYLGTDTEIVIPNTIDGYSITNIGKLAFSDCTKLINIVLPDTVTSLEKYAFDDCKNLESIEVNENNQKYKSEKGVLYSKDGTKIIRYPEGKKQEEYEMPENIIDIQDYAFNNCKNLINIEVNKNNPKYKSTNGVLYTKDGKEIVRYPEGKQQEEYKILEGTTKIGNCTFYGCNSLISIEIPEEVTIIEWSAFKKCNSLENIKIPKGVTILENSTFEECRNLKSIEIPEGVESIGRYTFAKCNNLISIRIPASVKKMKEAVFSGCERLATIIISVDFKPELESDIKYKKLDKNNKELSDETKLGTGMKVKLETGEIYEIIVVGDVNGDGQISITDMTKIKKHIIQKEILQGVYEKAGNIDNDSKIGVTDLAKMKKVLVGLTTI